MSEFNNQEDKVYYHVLSKEVALANLCESTNYPMLQENGQRCYGPPPDWSGPPPEKGCEIFIGSIPRHCYEDELVPIFEKVGKIYMFRLMMDFSGYNRGYAFCLYTNKEASHTAVQKLNNYCIRVGKHLGVCLSIDNCRLFVGGIPKDKNREEILSEMKKITEGVSDVMICPGAGDHVNKGFALVEYLTHKEAAMARRKLLPGRVLLWNHQISVNWAEPDKHFKQQQQQQQPTQDSIKKYLCLKNIYNSSEVDLKSYVNETLASYYCIKNDILNSTNNNVSSYENRFPPNASSYQTNSNNSPTYPSSPVLWNNLNNNTSSSSSSNSTFSNANLKTLLSNVNYPSGTSFVQHCIQINKTTYNMFLYRNEDYDVTIKILNDTLLNGEKIYLSLEMVNSNPTIKTTNTINTDNHYEYHPDGNKLNISSSLLYEQNLTYCQLYNHVNHHNHHLLLHHNHLHHHQNQHHQQQKQNQNHLHQVKSRKSSQAPSINNNHNNRVNQRYLACYQCNRQVNNADNAIMLNESVRDLTNFCIENHLGQPIYNININLWIDKLTGLKVPLYSVQIYIPKLDKTFQSIDLIEKFDEAVTYASTQILSWIQLNHDAIEMSKN